MMQVISPAPRDAWRSVVGMGASSDLVQIKTSSKLC
jgi:hypothetical protein